MPVCRIQDRRDHAACSYAILPDRCVERPPTFTRRTETVRPNLLIDHRPELALSPPYLSNPHLFQAQQHHLLRTSMSTSARRRLMRDFKVSQVLKATHCW